MPGVVGLQQLLRMQGIEWGDSGRGSGDFHLWFDGSNLYTDAVWSPQSGMSASAPAGSASGVTGGVFAYTTGAGGGGNARGGDYTITLGNGTGNKRSGQVTILKTETAPESDVTPALYVVTTYTPAQAGFSAQGAQIQLTTTGDATLLTGPSIASVELVHDYQATGVYGGSIIYGAETQMLFSNASGTVGVATGHQGNIRGTGSGTLTSGSAFRASIGAFAGPVTTMRGYILGVSYSGAATGYVTLIGFDSSAVVGNTASSTNTSGSYAAYGFQGAVPSQGGNTSGTNTNIAFRSSITASGAGGGAPGVNGTVENSAFWMQVPTGAEAGSGTGHTRNMALQITGNGSTNGNIAGGGGATNWAIFCNSTAQVQFAGTTYIGPAVSNDTILAAASKLIVTPTTSIVRAAGSTWKGVSVPASTLTITSMGAITTATGVNLVEIAIPAIATDAAGAITRSATVAILGAPTISGGGSITSAYALDVQTGNVFFGGLLTTYNNIAVGGNGVPSEVKVTRPAQQVNATVTLATYTLPASDGSYEIQANLNVTVSTTVTMTVTCSYTDEANVARVLTLPFFLLAGTLVQSITTAQGNIAYSSMPITIRAKASTTITIATAGTVTAVTYTGEGIIKQLA